MTPQQLAALKADILANAAAIGQIAIDQRDGNVIRAFYNAFPGVDFMVWRTEVPVNTIFDTIDWSKYTPTDAADGTAIYTNRALNIQTKQMNLQNMLIGRDKIDASKPNIRAGLRDATTLLPAGASGAAISASGASGATLLTACTRKATVGEKLLNAGSATTGTVTANLLGFEGQLAGQNILDALDS